MRWRASLLLLVAMCFLPRARASEPPPVAARTRSDWPYSKPGLRRLMEAATFHVSFDGGSMTPDMAEGEKYEPSIHKSQDASSKGPQFAEGLIGRALVLGSGSAVYPRAGNVLLERRGAIAVWIRPESWQRPKDGNCVFAMTSNATFYLQRQGPDQDEEGRVRRHEMVQYLALVPGERSGVLGGGSAWENGRWYLLVANWSWPAFELSVNGQPFAVKSLSGPPAEGVFGGLVLGDRGGSPRGLLDEFMAFRRPLTLDEAKLLYGLHAPSD